MGTITYIGKIITERAESAKWFATKGNIGFNAGKEVLLQGKDKSRYEKYKSS
ncbi:hypothetical protein [Pedobacter miscanthi]|uniref:hypothetical protein n=1 Tax=Pedobacter miscanthi TaxID=2259170 RepID=UPI00131404AB|nr:hypothetical protein [Pedobacter miscanthi]